MIAIINSWAQGIILAVVVSTIIEVILPEGNNKKYVKTIIGIYIIFVIVYPIFSKISNKEIDVNEIMKKTEYELKKTNTNVMLETNSYIEQEYEKKLKEELTKHLNEKGYSIQSLNIAVELENKEKYGQINQLDMIILRTQNINNNTNNIETVKKVNIQISEKNNVNNIKFDNLNTNEIEIIKNDLSDKFGVNKENISINEE